VDKLKFIMDMVHHNPGEAHFETKFHHPEVLKEMGYNAQVFKHINCAVNFEALDSGLFPQGSTEREWMDQLAAGITEQNRKAKEEGLEVYYHVDLFVLPVKLVEQYKDSLCYPGTRRISVEQDFTLSLHKVLLDEIFTRFPEVDGLIIRVGETYLYDSPYHMGNNPIRKAQYDTPDEDVELEAQRYVRLIDFLKEEVCVRHDKTLIFRTWDCYPDKFHADLDYYLRVSNRIEPHPKLVFSIKHTALDFWRRVKFNPCITEGRHQQIIEVQCQREYEGKGAYPNYIMDGVINGFAENKLSIGLSHVKGHPLVKGIYTWTRGGGWYGPYIGNELWCGLHASIIAGYASTGRKEEELFREYAQEQLGLSEGDAELFRSLCLLSSQAVLKGRYCEAFDRSLKESVMPTALWMRDDRLGGMSQLQEVFAYLADHGLTDEALAEKREAVELWTRIRELSQQLSSGSDETLSFIQLSSEYGLRLFKVVHEVWSVLLAGYMGERTGQMDWSQMEEHLTRYEAAWANYLALGAETGCPSLYTDRYLNLPGEPLQDGLGASVASWKEKCRQALAQ
jgi:hypothetical protein